MEPQQCNRVSRRRRSRSQLMVEDQPVGADCVSKMKCSEVVEEQVDQFTIVRCSKHDVGLRPTRSSDQFQQHRLPSSDSLHGVGRSVRETPDAARVATGRILEPDAEARLLVSVTVYEVSE